MEIKLKRVYEEPSPQDGWRVLVDRLWPRGLTKEKAHVDLWLRDLGPSSELRKWCGHDPAHWDEFRRRYAAELRGKQELLDQLTDHPGPITLLYGAKDPEHNQAVALREYLEASRSDQR
jgi:uncharacterized protein YeaO (DUF488 family)